MTNEDIYFPDYCLFFINEIMESLVENDITDPGDELDLELETHNYPYHYDGLNLVIKTLRKKGYTMSIPSYKRGTDNKMTYNIVVIKNGEFDDLPF